MEIKGDIGLYLSGEPVRIPTCGIYIEPPKIKDIMLFGEEKFFVAAQVLADIKNITKPIREGNNALEEVPDFQIFIEVLKDKNADSIKRQLESFFELCCPAFKIEYGKHSIDFKAEDDGPVVGMINTFTYQDFAGVVQELLLPPKADDDEIEYHIDENDAYSRRLLEKIKKNRERLAKIKAQEQGDGDVSLFGTYISVLAVGLQMDINLLYTYTPFQVYDLFQRYMAKYRRDKYEEMLMIPFADTTELRENEPDSWFANLYGPKKEKFNSFRDMNRLNEGLR